MTPSAEPHRRGAAAGTPFTDQWRHAVATEQEQALCDGSFVVSCPAPFGVGGLGRHLSEITTALDRSGRENVRLCEADSGSPLPDGSKGLRDRAFAAALAPLARVSPAWRMWAVSAGFDARAARALPAGDHLIAFNGTAITQFGAARRLGFQSLSLVAANSHYKHVIRQHDRAYERHPIERPWSTRLLRRNLQEYRLADRIYFASDYIRESFLDEGVPESLLTRFALTPDPRYSPGARAASSSATFDVVYVGSLTVHKGVPLLVEAFGRLRHEDLRLILVGGWGTRGMRRFIEGACASDPRISVRPGDPLAHLRGARLCAHPAYEDGFGYAPAEALACAIPVLVSEDTGMKELVDDGRNGLVLATGDLTALTEAIDAAYRGGALTG